MGKEISESTRLRVVRLYLEGLSYNDIAAKVAVGKGSVVAIIQDLKEQRFPQFENIADLVDGMRDMAVGLRKAGITPTEAANLFTLIRRFLELGVEPQYLEAWVKMSRSVATEEFPHSRAIQAAVKLARLEGEGQSYEETIGKLNASSTQLKELEKKAEELRTKVAQLEKSQQTLNQACQVLRLEKNRLETENQKMGKAFQDISIRCRELENRVVDRQAKVSRLEERDRELSKKLPQLEEKAAALKKETSERALVLKDMEDMGFSKDALAKLRSTFVEMEKHNGREGLVARFLEKIASYEWLVRLEADKEKLAGEVSTLTVQRDSLAQLGQKLGLTPVDVVDGIATLKALRKQGVYPSTIASYQRMLSNAGTDPQSFRKLVSEYAGVEQTLMAKRRQLQKQDEEVETKKRSLEQLRGEELKVKESISTLRESAVKEVAETAGLAAGEVRKLCQGLRDDIDRWGGVRAEIGQCQQELKLARYFTSIPLSEGALSSLVDDIDVLMVVQYLGVALAWCRKKHNPKQRPPRVVLSKYLTITDFTPVELADVIAWALAIVTEGIGRDTR